MDMDTFQTMIFNNRYSYDNEDWSGCCKRVSRAIAFAEINDRDEWEREFFNIIHEGFFIPGGRILKNAGLPKQAMMNCFFLDVEDNINSIGTLLKNVYTVSCNHGGIGMNFSKIRPKGAILRGEEGKAPGSISNMKMIDSIGKFIKSGGGRRVALLGCLDIHHPDLLEFLHVKQDLNQLNNFNISVNLTNEFFEALKEDKEWHFKFKGQVWYTYKAIISISKEKKEIIFTAKNKELAEKILHEFYMPTMHYKIEKLDRFHYTANTLFDLIVKNAWKCGEPGIMILDNMNKYNNTGYWETIGGSNPCGEVPLSNAASCCLGNINLSEMWSYKWKKINIQRLRKTIQVAVRFLDNVIELNLYPLEIIKEVSQSSRRIGLGVMGLGHLCILAGVKYGSEEMIEFIDNLFQVIRNETYKASIELAKEKGAFPRYIRDRYLEGEFIKTLPPTILTAIKRHGIRNACLLSCPPTGTTSMLARTSSGIEPVYAPIIKRTYRKGDKKVEKIVVDKVFQEILNKDEDISVVVSALNVPPEEHIAVQATIQKYYDLSISKTINLRKDYPAEKLKDNIIAYVEYCKGFTFYRQGSRGEEPLQEIDISKMSKDEIKELIKK